MWRRLLLLTVTVALATGLSGCATTYEYYGDERYHEPAGGVVYDSYPDDGGYAYSGSSAYYDAGYGYYADPDWYAYPAYYSMFWSLNRWYVDPFWHPSFYYGVTFFPRHYFAVSFRSWPRYSGHYWWPPYYRYVPYAPYRGAWFDYYYDWTPWYAHHPHIRHHYAPRYGNVRHETERLTNWSRRGDSYQQWRLDDRNISYQREPGQLRQVRDRTDYYRGATTGDRNARRADPDVRGFSGREDARSNRPSTRSRTDPGVRGFSTPAPEREASRGALPTKPYGETRGASSGTVRGTDRRGVDRSGGDRGMPIVRRDPPSDQTRTTQRSNTEGGERYTTIRSYERSSGSSRRSYSGSEADNSRPQPSTRRDSGSERWSVPAPSSRPSVSRSATPTPSYRQPTEPRGYTPRSLERPAEPSRSYSAPTRSYTAPAPASRDYSRPSRPEPAARPQFEMRSPPAERSQPQRAEPLPERGGREARSDEDDGRRERGRR